MKYTVLAAAVCAAIVVCSCGPRDVRTETLLDTGWRFHRGEEPGWFAEGEAAQELAGGKDLAEGKAVQGTGNGTVQGAGNAAAQETGPTSVKFDDSAWQEVEVPHDWAIYGPFDEENDLQTTMIVQDGERIPQKHTGRTGGLPYVGVGWYRTTFNVPAGRRAVLVFDGAMSQARVWVNGKQVAWWPCGYNSFWCDVTDALSGRKNALAVRLENLPQSSRWYPGAGLFRNVHLIVTGKTRIPVWGIQVTTPQVSTSSATAYVRTTVDGDWTGSGGKKGTTVRTTIYGPAGEVVASGEAPVDEAPAVDAATASSKTGDRASGPTSGLTSNKASGPTSSQAGISLQVSSPQLWSPSSPVLYTCTSEVLVNGKTVDRSSVTFGFRKVEFSPEKGMLLNGKPMKFQGVCMHHDLGPLGAAVNESAIAHQVEMLKDMGCNAIRTSHNMPAPELVSICDRAGMMLMVEPFDEWDRAKCKNGYHLFFDEWAEKDMVNMIRQYRNSPSVVMWSIGNEVPTQSSPDGVKVARFLQDICHREDPTRLVTCGMDRVDDILRNGFGAAIDIPGLNYRTFKYLEAYATLPQGLILGSETGSTLSSRGVYKLPAGKRFGAMDPDHQCSAYDQDAAWWSNTPDVDFALAEDYPWTLGQFVWTGWDYLGEPTPYGVNSWPNHSSMFGIVDLASIPKDRYWLFRSVWNTESPTLHVLPHWNWEEEAAQSGGRLGVPVYVYTSWPEAELFVNGVSMGRVRKTTRADYAKGGRLHRAGSPTDNFKKDAKPSGTYGSWMPAEDGRTQGGQCEQLDGRYRLIWPAVPYQAGELKVIAYDSYGEAKDTAYVRTAGAPDHIVLTASCADYSEIFDGKPQQSASGGLEAGGKDLLYVTASVVDKDGNLCPEASDLLSFSVTGAASFRAAANGDPTCLYPFHEPSMPAFSGRTTVIVAASDVAGNATLEVSAPGLKSASLPITVRASR